MLIRYLPPESHTATAMREDMTPAELDALPQRQGHGPWSTVELLLAAIVDGLGVLAWQQGQIHGSSRTPPPEPLRRPGVAPRHRARLMTPAGRAALQAMRTARQQQEG